MSTISLPELSLVVLVGPSGAGKSSFARRHFKPTEVVSSDVCRALVSDDENDQSATPAAFEVLAFIVGKRLAAGKLDATVAFMQGKLRIDGDIGAAIEFGQVLTAFPPPPQLREEVAVAEVEAEETGHGQTQTNAVESPRCHGTTKSGKPCRNHPLPSSDYCHHHQPV